MNGTDKSQSLEKYLSNWDESYRKEQKYFDMNNKPDTYPLTGFYPLWTEDESANLDKIIDDIIAKTDLFVPERKLCSAGWDRPGAHSVGDFETSSLVPELIAERKFTNGIIVLHSSDLFVRFFQKIPEIARKSSQRIKK